MLDESGATTQRRRRALLGSSIIALPAVALGAVWLAIGPGIVRDAYHGQSSAWLNGVVARHRAISPGARDLNYYEQIAWLPAWWLIVAALCAGALWWAWVYRAGVGPFLRARLLEPDSPFNLAIFRVVLFLTTWVAVEAHAEQLRFLASLPADVRFRPPLLIPLQDWVTPTPETVGAAIWAVRAVCALGILGALTPVMLGLSLLLSVYLLGFLWFFGINRHIYHVLPIVHMVMLCARCADVLAIDAVWRAAKRADAGEVRPPANHARYGVPLRLVWVVIGIAYFFPGLWKLLMAPWAYASGENVRTLMWAAWLDFDPPFRIDQYGILMSLGGVGVLVFELGWVFIVFWRAMRPLLAAAGVAFHQMTLLFMDIPFHALCAMYASIIDWAGLSRWLSRRIGCAPVFVLYDGHCTLCRRTAGALGTIDLTDRLRFISLLDEPARRAAGLGHLREDDLVTDMHAAVVSPAGVKVWRGFEAYRAIAARVPMLWIVWPWLWLPPVAWAGRKVYRRVADSRLCALDRGPAGPLPGDEAHPDRAPDLGGAAHVLEARTRAVLLVSAVVLAVMLFMGITRNTSPWPISCFPPFAGPAPLETNRGQFVVVDATGAETVWRPSRLIDGYSEIYWRTIQTAMWRRAEYGPADEAVVRRALRSWLTLEPPPAGATALRIYRVRMSIVPERKAEPPIERALILEEPLTP